MKPAIERIITLALWLTMVVLAAAGGFLAGSKIGVAMIAGDPLPVIVEAPLPDTNDGRLPD